MSSTRISPMHTHCLLILSVIAMSMWIPPYLQARYQPITTQAGWSDLTLKDPPLDTRVSPDSSNKGNYVVAFISDCGPCNASRLRELQALSVRARTKKRVLVCGKTSESEIAEMQHKFAGLELQKATPEVVTGWNVSFMPRVYGVSDGWYRYIQNPSADFSQSIRLAISQVEERG